MTIEENEKGLSPWIKQQVQKQNQDIAYEKQTTQV